jgi:hypothetical protein
MCLILFSHNICLNYPYLLKPLITQGMSMLGAEAAMLPSHTQPPFTISTSVPAAVQGGTADYPGTLPQQKGLLQLAMPPSTLSISAPLWDCSKGDTN